MSHKSDIESLIFVGPLIHSISLQKLEFIQSGIVVIVQGKIVLLKKKRDDLKDIQEQFNVKTKDVHILTKGQFLIPGFVDTHIHGSQYPNVGLGYDMPLLQWLETYTFPLEKKFEDENFARNVYSAVVKRTLANGTTTASYYATIHKKSSCVFANCIKEHGQRAFVGKVNMNKNIVLDYGETFEQSISDTEEFIQYILDMKNPLIKPIITPRFALSCDMKLLKELGKLAAKYDIPIQTHVSENLEEIKQVEKEFPDCENYISVYNNADLINRKTILAHGIYLKPEELKIIKEKGATISHCPSSNLLLHSGICTTYEYLRNGLKVSLGTDCSGGNSCSMLDCIRQTLMVSIVSSFNRSIPKLSVDEIFYMATLGGAEALGLGSVTGNFATGKYFDAILVDLYNTSTVDIFEDYNLHQLFQKFIYLGNDSVMRKVFVAGACVKQL